MCVCVCVCVCVQFLIRYYKIYSLFSIISPRKFWPVIKPTNQPNISLVIFCLPNWITITQDNRSIMVVVVENRTLLK